MGLIRKALEIIDKKTNIGLAFSKKTESENNLVSETKPSLLKRVQKIQSDFFQSDSIPDGIFHETEEDTLVDLDVLDVAVQEEGEENEERDSETSQHTPSKEELPSIEIENFAGNLEKIDIGEGEDELLEEDLEPQEVIDLDEEASITKADELKEWEEAAKQDIDDELEKTLLKEISKQNEFQDTLEQIQTQVSETEKEIQASKENKAGEELELLQKKLENYLVLLEITKDLVKSSDFEEFFENLLYSIEGQLGPESIVIFSKRNADSEYFQAYAFDGVEIEPELKLHKSEPACQIFQNLEYPKFAREIPSEGLPEKDWSILNNPFT
ncbi:MAG: hypothetical protein N3A69_10485, partial [Leptospiraceae bacterium]|nr:hypothetical protein [Leptospiraceae bacterium]